MSEPTFISLNNRDRESEIRDLFEIRRHAEIIVAHREDPCEYWTGHGCEASMVHDAEGIMRLVDGLIPSDRA